MKTNVHLQRDVLEELDWEPSVDAAHVGVTANDGVVTLTGHVPVYAEKHAAEEVAKRVHGARAVANEIEVRPSQAQVRDDEEIASAAVHALKWDATVPAEGVRVTVEGGWITVEGTVEQQFQYWEGEAPAEPKALPQAAQRELRPPGNQVLKPVLGFSRDSRASSK